MLVAMTEDQNVFTPTKVVSPSKLSMNHGHFIANLDLQESPSKTATSATGNYSSTRVIESLHRQIDELTNTNLKITSQCHQLVTELESSGKIHRKQVENISRLQTENVNLSALLDRKTQRLEELEASLQELTTSKGNADELNENLKQKINDLNKEKQHIEEEAARYKIEYDALFDSQQRYKDHFTSEVDTLKQSVTELKTSMAEQVDAKFQEAQSLESKISEKLDHLQNLEASYREMVNGLLDENIKGLELEKWTSLLKQSQELMKAYKTQAQSEGINVQESQSSLAQLRIAKRKTSSQKRTSFYGTPSSASSAGPSSAGTSNSSRQLPGLKRSTSIRVPSDPDRNK